MVTNDGKMSASDWLLLIGIILTAIWILSAVWALTCTYVLRPARFFLLRKIYGEDYGRRW